MHRIIRALVLANESGRDLVESLKAENSEATLARVAQHLDQSNLEAVERDKTLKTFVDLRPDLHLHFRRSLRKRPLFPEWGWLKDPRQYAYIRAMFEQGRIRFVKARIEGKSGLLQISQSARTMGVPIRVLYLSNWENRWKRLPKSVRDNLLSFPLDERSLVLRTISGRRWNRKPGFSRWHYNIHVGQHLQQLVKDPKTKNPRSMMPEREVLSDYLSWLGPHVSPALAQRPERDIEGSLQQ
jgi:hypothetical protein